jgi:hypothetical protein
MVSIRDQWLLELEIRYIVGFGFCLEENYQSFKDSLIVYEIMPISLLYKRYTLKKLNQKNYKVTLNIFSSDDAFMDHIEKRFVLKG